MHPMEQMADVLTRHFGVIEMTLADFSDADLLVRPVPGANHALWQLGHLVTSTAYFASGIPGCNVPEIPNDWRERFNGTAAKSDDPKAFPDKADLLRALSAIINSMADAVRKLMPEDLDKPAPARIQSFAPTVGVLIGVTAPHWMMHVGQFQVIRRKLGKPVLF